MTTWFRNFVQRYRNAKAVIEQVKRGEWEPSWNELSGQHITVRRGNRSIWVYFAPWFCEQWEPTRKPVFGLLFRHWVWWSALRKLVKKANREKRKQSLQVPDWTD